MTAVPPRIEVRDLRKSFVVPAGDLTVLDGVSLRAGHGELVSILGPSGCGKSTIFAILTGVVEADGGAVLVDGEPLGVTARPFAWMPQRDVLMPWRTVVENVALGLEVAGRRRRRDAVAKAREMLPAFGLEGFADARPFQLSGGMRQRAALARTVAQGRDVLLLDEPFGALDALTRTQLQLWLEEVWEAGRWTVLLITHDVREAVLLSDRIYVLDDRPARVRAEVVVDLPRPRTLATLSDPRVVALERDLLAALTVGSGR